MIVLEKKITILPHTPKDFIIPWNGKFDMERAILYGGTMAGECYESEGFEKLSKEEPKKSIDRGKNTAINEHYTTHEHIHVGLEIINFSKFVAMTLNNERQLVTSEKSARYTEIDASIDPAVTKLEQDNYQKWIKLLIIKIEKEYPGMFTKNDLQKKAQENARYMVTGFVATKMNHTVPLAQLNRVTKFMEDFCNQISSDLNPSDFDKKLAEEYSQFIDELEDLGLLDERLKSNKKGRKLSMFGDRKVENYFGDTYSVSYKGSIAQYAQSHRHRTISHNMLFDKENHEFYIPEIIKNDDFLANEWIKDITCVGNCYPQGKLITINERGTIEDLVMKAQERRCAAAQLEIDIQTAETLKMAAADLEIKEHPDAQKVKQFSLGPRCMNGYNCNSTRCKFPGTKDNKRLI